MRFNVFYNAYPLLMKKASFCILIISLTSMGLYAQAIVSAARVNLSYATFIPYSIDSVFTISVPDYLVQVNYLSTDARLQFCNEMMNTYTIVATENKSRKENNDLTSLVKRFEKNVKVKGGKILESNDLSISGCPGKILKLIWTVDGEPTMYVASFIDTQTMLYKVYSWTSVSQKELEGEFIRIALSFARADAPYLN